MIRRLFRLGVRLGILAGVGFAIYKFVQARRVDEPRSAPSSQPWPPVPAPQDWVEAQDKVCPPSHPIKAKLASHLYHLPGMLNYTRTRPDRCYATEAAAMRDGFSAAKR